ncbi:MAG: 16S rRNA (cytosine(1402)-N(4))-methyltransferase RsmH [Nitratireductor sp.]|nr:16S rRNA (cytosine(1402)-N(4))-methyltransferase RsmH [Nitratireductor sp.]
MMTDRSGDTANAGGPVRHVPVMLDEVLAALAPGPGSVIVDGTFGAGGYSAAIARAGADVIAIDRDPDAIRNGRAIEAASGGRLVLKEGRFSTLDEIAFACGHEQVDGVVLDIGVSSMQIDEADRGFSFQKDGPLDMRMEQAGPSAADVVNRAAQNDLIRIIGILGEEKQASRIARAIVERRTAMPFTRTLDLANLIEKVIGRKPGERIHPATRTFQALRIFVNGELEELASALCAAERLLDEGGRLVVVTFHSLEDRIVKRFLGERSKSGGGSRHMPAAAGEAPTFSLPGKAMVAASEAEALANPRARSAKLRMAVRTQVAPRGGGIESVNLPRLASLSQFAQTGGAGHVSHA